MKELSTPSFLGELARLLFAFGKIEINDFHAGSTDA